MELYCINSQDGGNMDVRIVGWGHTAFGNHQESTLEDLITTVASRTADL